MATPTKWESKPKEAFIISDLDQLFEVFKSMADTLTGVLDTTQGGLESVKTFLVEDVNPVLLALTFILDQMLSIIQNLKNTGVHVLAMYPSAETHSLWRDAQTEQILYRDLLAGFDPNDDSGFYILNRDDAFDKFVRSFDDKGDTDNPAFPQFASPGFLDTFVAGGVVIFAGALPSSSLLAGQLVEEILRTFCTISQLFLRLFNLDSFKQMKLEICGALDDVVAARTSTTTAVTVLDRPGHPNWKAIKLTRDIIPSLGTVLDSMEGVVQGVKDQVKGAKSFIDDMIAFIDVKLKEIQEIRDAITDFLDYIDDLNQTIQDLGKFNFATLVVDEQIGGINILKQAVLDDGLEGRPDQDLFYCSLVSFVSSGTGFSFLLFLLGLSDTFSTGADPTVFSEDAIRQKYELD